MSFVVSTGDEEKEEKNDRLDDEPSSLPLLLSFSPSLPRSPFRLNSIQIKDFSALRLHSSSNAESNE